jgi:hypothetical protein
MKTYYSDAQFDEILQTFGPAPGFDKDRFREGLERVAWFYDEWKADTDELKTDAHRRDFARTLSAAARSLQAKIREAEASTLILEALRHASRGAQQEQAKASGPEADATRVYLRLQRLKKELEWLRELSDDAAEAMEIGKGGNRPDEPLHELILSVADLYREVAENPREPTGWQESDNKKGEFLGLLQAVLRPISVEMSLPGLRQAYLRALKRVSKP